MNKQNPRKPSQSPISIIGAGVSGLSVGVWLAKCGFPVTIWCKPNDARMVSPKAGAIWLPYQAKPQAFINELAMTTFAILEQMATSAPNCGVAMVEAQLLFKKASDISRVPYLGFLKSNGKAVKPKQPGYQSSYLVTVPFIDTTLYLPFLKQAFLNAGGTIEHKELRSLKCLKPRSSFLINCSGLGARELVNDSHVFPIRGQVIRTTKWSDTVFLIDDSDESLPGYIFSRAHDCLLGGTAEVGEEDLTPSEVVHTAIYERCKKMDPGLETAQILEDAVGLRPGRHQLRLEAASQHSQDMKIFHNYGHGGSGFTISWGCAKHIVSWIAENTGLEIPLQFPFD